jgi:hypothetical protein
MTMPTFTAEASLYQTKGHYQTRSGRHAVNSSAQKISPVYPALRGGETIHVHSCAPGFTDIGGVCWPNPLTEPPVGAGGGGGGPPGGGLPDDGGGGGGGPSVPVHDPGWCRPPYRPNPDYDPEICKACREECDIAHPITPCEGSKLWCQAINAEEQRKRDDCYEDTCGWRCHLCI